MKSRAIVLAVLAAGLWTVAGPQAQTKASTTDKAFVSGGKVEMQLEAGNYAVRAAADNHIRVALNGNPGNARADLTISGTHASLSIKDTPRSNFQATIEVPKATDLVVRLSAGDLIIAPIVGNKDISSTAGNVEIGVGPRDDYSSVDASVKVGDINAGAFGGSKSGLFPHFTWSGHGKYTLHANLGAGNLTLRDK